MSRGTVTRQSFDNRIQANTLLVPLSLRALHFASELYATRAALGLTMRPIQEGFARNSARADSDLIATRRRFPLTNKPPTAVLPWYCCRRENINKDYGCSFYSVL